MGKYYVERVVVMVLGFVVGAVLAMSVVPGDILLGLAAGACLSLFSHMFFAKNFGGDLFWPFFGHHRHRKHRASRPRTTSTHR